MKNAGTKVGVASVLMVCCAALNGCRKDPGPAQWDVDLLAPLVTTSFTIRDIVPDSLITADAQGAITLLYASELFAVDLDTVLKAPDTTFVYGAGLAQGQGSLFLPAGFTISNQSDVTRFDLEDLELRYLKLREGTLSLEMRNEIASGIVGTFSLPGATFPDGNSSLRASVGPGTVVDPAFATEARDLAGAAFDLRGPTYSDVNTLATSIILRLDSNGTGATVNGGDSVRASVTYGGLVPSYARGYFGNRIIHVGPEVTDLDLFRNVISGTLDVDQVTLRLAVENGIGMDVRVDLDHLRAVNTHTGNTVDLSHAIMQGPINLDRAVDLGNGFTPSVYTNELDNSDSNVDAFLENLPDQLSYELDLHLNPLGDVSNGHDFLYYESALRANLELEVPLRVIATDLTLQSIVDPDLPEGQEGHALLSGQLDLYATNGFPFSAGLVMDIVDVDGNVLSNVPVDGVVAAGILGQNGRVQQSVASRLSARLSESDVDHLYAGGRFRLRIPFNTASQTQHLQILDTYRMDVQVVAGAHYLVNGDE